MIYTHTFPHINESLHTNNHKKINNKIAIGYVAHTFYSNTRVAEVGRVMGVWGQPHLHSEFKDS